MYGVSLKDNLRYIRRGSNETAHCWYRDHLVQPSLAQSEVNYPSSELDFSFLPLGMF